MKSTERRHLKEHELAQAVSSARDYIEPRQKQLTMVLVGLAVVALAVFVGYTIRERSRSKGQDLLAKAMVALNARVVPVQPGDPTDVPAAAQFQNTGTYTTEEAKLNAAVPQLKAAADAYPDADAGIEARYHLAGAYASLGKANEAISAFDDVIKRAGGDSLYGHMAKFGKADTLARSGQVDAAIAAWKDLAAQTSAEVPQDAVLMELAKAYMAKGNKDEAKKTYTQLVDQHPDSVYTGEARQELENLKRAA